MNEDKFSLSPASLNRLCRELLRHPSFDEMEIYRAGMLRGNVKSRVKFHIGRCSECQEYLEGCRVWDGPEGAKRLKALQTRLRFALNGIGRSLRDKALGRKRGPGKVLKMADKKRRRQ